MVWPFLRSLRSDKGGGMVKEWDFRPKKNQNKCKKSNNQLCLMLYGHFPARNGSKSTTYLSKSEKVNKAQGWTLVDLLRL